MYCINYVLYCLKLSAINDCAGSPCQNNGTCTDLVGGFLCQCASGWTGSTCAQNIDECSPNPCLNGGTCMDAINSFTCECAVDFTGITCETSEFTNCEINTVSIKLLLSKLYLSFQLKYYLHLYNAVI